MFRPITMNEEERYELIRNSFSKEILLKYAQECDSLESFHSFLTQMRNGVEAQMQLYILENYEKVPLDVWNKDNFKIVPHLGKEVIYFGKEDKFEQKWKIKPLAKWAKERYEKSIKIESISFTLDIHDGDFSVKFNDDAWTFLWGDDVLTYYYTIKNYLNGK